MSDHGLSQNAPPRALNSQPRRINEIVMEKWNITAGTALRLARYFGPTAELWTGLQVDYDSRLARYDKEEKASVTLNRGWTYNQRWPDEILFVEESSHFSSQTQVHGAHPVRSGFLHCAVGCDGPFYPKRFLTTITPGYCC